MMKNEIWSPIKRFNDYYEVSDKGNVRSVDRIIFNEGNQTECRVKGRVLSPSKSSHGYASVILYDSVLKFRKTLKVHRLVAFAFVDGYEEGLEVNHKNGVRDDNRAENLEWVTRSINMRDTYKRGRDTNGEKNGAAKLKNREVDIITRLYDMGVTQKIISKAFNVSQGTISNIINNKHYKDQKIIPKGLAEPIELTNKD